MANITKEQLSRMTPAYRQWEASMHADAGIFLPLRTQTPGNGRRHWRLDAREARQQRDSVSMALLACAARLPAFPVQVSFTRYGPGKLPDRHNLPGMLKHVIDAVAKFYGVDDGDPRWQFVFSSARQKWHGVRIEITPLIPLPA